MEVDDKMLINNEKCLLDDIHKIPKSNQALNCGEPAKYLNHEDSKKDRAAFDLERKNNRRKLGAVRGAEKGSCI